MDWTALVDFETVFSVVAFFGAVFFVILEAVASVSFFGAAFDAVVEDLGRPIATKEPLYIYPGGQDELELSFSECSSGC